MGVAQTEIEEIETKPWTISLDRISPYARALGARLELLTPEIDSRIPPGK
jgi:hypothetical protein